MLIAALTHYFFGITIFLMSLFLILLVLVQRGRGGGLTGALGGPGGQSAFGTKAGDLFTKITIGVAAAWILLCVAAVMALKTRALPTFGAEGTANTMSSSSDETGGSESSSGSSLGDLLNDDDDGTLGLGGTSGLGTGSTGLGDDGLDLSPSGDSGTAAEVTDLPSEDDNTGSSETPAGGSTDGDSTTAPETPEGGDATESTEPAAEGEGTTAEEPTGENSAQ
ncbi:MAG: preprotein translocase subunit SecG [Planctomycetota bacterium]|nr:preprotein translocase subunit SecG [Planctomycetota bacterium]